MLAPEPLACSTNFSFRLMTRSSLQGIRPEDHRQRCPETFVSAMSWYCTLGTGQGVARASSRFIPLGRSSDPYHATSDPLDKNPTTRQHEVPIGLADDDVLDEACGAI